MSRMVQISELSFYTRQGRRILEDITLRIDRGELAFLIGAPGAGKTLLLKLIYGELKPDQGQILVDGLNVTRIGSGKLKKLRRRIGMAPQNPTLIIRKTVHENIIFTLRSLGQSLKEARRKSEEALKAVSLWDVKDFPLNNLSSAEIRKLSIACGISKDPVLLLCDGPLFELDQESKMEVCNGIKRVHERKRVTLLATARALDFNENFQARRIFLGEGKVVEGES